MYFDDIKLNTTIDIDPVLIEKENGKDGSSLTF